MSQSQFMNVEEHFKARLSTLDNDEQTLYRSLTHVRSEACFQNRTFVVYEIERRAPVVIDNLRILDFNVNEKVGASTEIYSSKLQSSLIVGYTPIQLFHYPIFVFLPLHGKLRWSTPPEKPLGGTLAFDLMIRTQSRLMLRERNVTYCETGVTYGREFETPAI